MMGRITTPVDCPECGVRGNMLSEGEYYRCPNCNERMSKKRFGVNR